MVCFIVFFQRIGPSVLFSTLITFKFVLLFGPLIDQMTPNIGDTAACNFHQLGPLGPDVTWSIPGLSLEDMQKNKFFTQTWFQPKIFYQKKYKSYDESNLQQNRVKCPKDTNNAKKMPKSNIKFQNLPKIATKKRKIARLLTFSTTQRKI